MASFGEKLRRERELRGIELREIADATKISLRFLQALEEDRVDVLPGGLFPRAFVRQYAEHLGLDPERLVAEFAFALGEAPPPTLRGRPAPAPREARRRSAFVIPALVLAAGIYGLKDLGSPPEPAAAPPPTPLPLVVPTDRVYPPPSEGATVPVPSEAGEDRSAGSGDAAPAEAGEPRRLVLTLNATQSCWVAANVDGQPILNRVLNEGESATLEAEGEIVLSVGNAGGIAISINDRPALPLGKSGEVKRNIVINRDNAPSLVDAPPVRASRSS